MEQLFIRSEEDIGALSRCGSLAEQSELGQEIKSTLLRIQSAIKVRRIVLIRSAELMRSMQDSTAEAEDIQKASLRAEKLSLLVPLQTRLNSFVIPRESF